MARGEEIARHRQRCDVLTFTESTVEHVCFCVVCQQGEDLEQLKTEMDDAKGQVYLQMYDLE